MPPTEPAPIHRLASARRALAQSLDRSASLAAALSRATPRLADIHSRLPSLEAAVRPIRADPPSLHAAAAHIDRAVGPAAAVLKVFDAVHGLERPLLSDPRHDLQAYLSVLKRLQEALFFLADNSRLAIEWLDDILDYLNDQLLVDNFFVANLKELLINLKNFPSALDGGLLSVALEKLEGEFRRLILENTSPVVMPDDSKVHSNEIVNYNNEIAAGPMPGGVIAKLQLILERMAANDRLDRCVAVYVEVRGSNVRASLRGLELGYLEIGAGDFEDVQSIVGFVDKWGRHLEFAVKHLFEGEYKLCGEVFESSGDVAASCFAEIAAQAGMLAFLRFGKTVAEAKKDPIKLLKLLDIFSVLNRLRLDFNRLFGGKACVEIQNQTRELIKKVVDGASEIFWELLVQVELQRKMPPPVDGAVPKFVSFIIDYCNKLISDEYRPVLMQVLAIHRSWKKEKFHDRLLTDAILSIVTALEVNFETWLKGYDDAVLADLFQMNMHWHFFKHLKGTKLGVLLGDKWLKDHEQYKDFFAASFLRESWGKLPSLLSREGLILFSGGRATTRDLVKKRLKNFNETFDEMYQKQSSWVISDRDLKEKMCQLIIQAIVPAYRSYMQNYGPLVEQDASASKYAKYTSQSLEKMLGSLFQHKPARTMSLNVRHSNGNVNNVVTSLCRSASTVT